MRLTISVSEKCCQENRPLDTTNESLGQNGWVSAS
jgi:hypothetical protein